MEIINMKHKAKNSNLVAEKMVKTWQRKADQEMRRVKCKKASRLLRAIMISSLIVTSACSLADPSVSGYIAGGQAEELNMPESGTVIVEHRYTRLPNGQIGQNGGRVFNQSAYDKPVNKFTAWLFGEAK